jgi:DNA-binding CsgD family transcriptional regulator
MKSIVTPTARRRAAHETAIAPRYGHHGIGNVSDMPARIAFIIGLALYWPMLRGNFFVMPLQVGSSPLPVSVLYALVLACAALVGFSSGTRRFLLRHRRSCLVLGTLSSVASTLLLATANTAPSEALSLLSSIAGALLCFAFALISIGWGIAASRSAQAPKYTFDIALGYLLSFPLTIASQLLGCDQALAALLPLLSSGALAVYGHLARQDSAAQTVEGQGSKAREQPALVGESITASHASAPSAGFSGKPLLNMRTLVMVACFVLVVSMLVGLINMPNTVFDDGGPIRQVISIVFALAMVLIIAVGKNRPLSALFVLGLILICLFAGTLCDLLFEGNLEQLGTTLVVTGRRALWPMLLVLLAQYARRLPTDEVARLFAIAFTLLNGLARLVTCLARDAFASGLAENTDAVSTMIILIGLLVLVVIGFAFTVLFAVDHAAELRSLAGAQREQHAESPAEGTAATGGARFEGQGGGFRSLSEESALGSAAKGATRQISRREACENLARQYQLTDREADVLEWLSEGNTVSYIAKTHGIAENTVRSHTKALYRKVGLHSKQDIINLVAAEMNL